MREIKFRAWDDSGEKPYMLGPYELTDSIFNHKDVRSLRLMQYTGLKDKNGKEIYEGDIVKGVWHGKNTDVEIFGEVDFSEGMFGLENKVNGEPYTINRIFVEVIGNIYETPSPQ